MSQKIGNTQLLTASWALYMMKDQSHMVKACGVTRHCQGQRGNRLEKTGRITKKVRLCRQTVEVHEKTSELRS